MTTTAVIDPPTTPDNAGAPPAPAAPISPPALDWQQRAAAAERRASELQAQLAEAQTSLTEAQLAAQAAQQRAQIERALVSQGAVDLETAALLAEQAVSANSTGDTAGAIASAVADLKRRKPFLFRTPAVRTAPTMAGEVVPSTPIDEAALEARHSGDRRALMRYLRLRRGT